MDDVDLNLLRAQLLQRIAQRFNRAVNVSLDDQVQFLEFSDLDSAAEFFEGDRLLSPDALFTLKLLSLGVKKIIKTMKL